jgi:hypothetical protein
MNKIKIFKKKGKGEEGTGFDSMVVILFFSSSRV